MLLVYRRSNAQPPKNQLPDTSKMIQVKEDTALAQELQDYLKALNKISHEDYLKLTPDQVIINFYQWVLIERTKKKKQK